MFNGPKLVVCFGAGILAALASGQAVSATTDEGGRADIAYIYIAYTPQNSSTNEIAAYSASAEGKLTPLPGSPLREDVTYMAATGSYLFADDRETPAIDAYRIEPDGELEFASSSDYSKYNPDNAGIAGQLVLDHWGQTLYVMEYQAYNDNNIYASFNIDKADGSLEYLGFANEGAPSFGAAYLAPTFVGNNVYAYTATNSDCTYFETTGLVRAGNGLLSNLGSLRVTMPAPPPGARIYCPQQAAADPTNHVAITLQPANPPGGAVGDPMIGSFTADSNGDLSTTNTRADMPKTEVTFANAMQMSPSGKFLAVGGAGGLQVFHFNGANPVTRDTGLLTRDTIAQMFWDKDNHLYAITQSGMSSAPGKLFVYTVTPTGVTEAPGSPYTIYNPQAILVHSIQQP